jgi:hypothetical protein
VEREGAQEEGSGKTIEECTRGKEDEKVASCKSILIFEVGGNEDRIAERQLAFV